MFILQHTSKKYLDFFFSFEKYNMHSVSNSVNLITSEPMKGLKLLSSFSEVVSPIIIINE